MTADRAALVEKVGKLLWYDGSGFDVPNHLLTAAIDLIRAEVLEEAARVVENDIDEPYTMEDRAKNAARKYAADAIRALKDKP